MLYTIFCATCVIWIYSDCRTNHIGRVPGKTDLINLDFNLPGWLWASATVLVPYLVLPLYLYKRNGLIERASTNPSAKQDWKGEIIFISFLFVVVIFKSFNLSGRTDLPQPQETVVNAQLPEAATNNGNVENSEITETEQQQRDRIEAQRNMQHEIERIQEHNDEQRERMRVHQENLQEELREKREQRERAFHLRNMR